MQRFELTAKQQYRLLLLFIRADTSKEGRLSMQVWGPHGRASVNCTTSHQRAPDVAQVFDELCYFVVNSR